jgi:uncharacterized protein
MNPKTELVQYANNLEIIDAHEHLISETAHLKRYLSFYDFFASYLQWDLFSAGMPKEFIWNYPKNDTEALQHFLTIEPYWKYVQHGSYARPIRLALDKFYDIKELHKDNILELSAIMNRNNQAGYYNQIFDQAKIKYIINQSPEHPFDDPRFIYGKPISYYDPNALEPFFVAQPKAELEDFLTYLETDIQKAVAQGAKSAKVFSVFLMKAPNEKAARAEFKALKAKKATSLEAFQTFVYDQTLMLCAKYGLVATVHTGVWTDLNKQNPELMFPVVERHPETRFDIYHMGIPFVRSCAFLGKSYPNVNLNLCWSHAVSERMTFNALDEWLDLIPTNKITGFGGDLITIPEHVWAMLEVAKENICKALAHRIERQRLDLDGAKEILQLWLHDNPMRIYKLEETGIKRKVTI